MIKCIRYEKITHKIITSDQTDEEEQTSSVCLLPQMLQHL